MDTRRIKVTAGDVFSSNADAILIPVSLDESFSNQIADQLEKHWQVQVKVPKLPVGDTYSTNINNAVRKDNGNPNNLLVFTNLGAVVGNYASQLAKVFRRLADISKEKPFIREFAIPLHGPEFGNVQLEYIYQQIEREFFQYSNPECSIEFCVDSPDVARLMTSIVTQGMSDSSKKRTLVKKYNSPSSRNGILSSHFYIIRGFADRTRKTIDPSSSLLDSHDSSDTLDLFRSVPIGSVVFLSINVASSVDYLPISAIGEVVGNEGGKLAVVWFSEGFSAQIKNRNYPLRSIVEVVMDYEKKEMYEILKSSPFAEFTTEIFVPDLALSRRPGVNTDFSNDYEIGEDFLEIADDVDAFARIVSLRELRPPLAIALCGKWGAGKSFFMGKMIDKMKLLSNSNNPVFCKGMLHVKFNAWSYLDSSLWAGIVTKIFNGINEYINNSIESEDIKAKLKKELEDKISLSQQSVFKMESEKSAIQIRVKGLEDERDELAKGLKAEIDSLQKRSFTEFLSVAVKEFDVEKKIDDALRANKSVSEVSSYIEKHFPEELWADGKWMKKEVSFWKTFFKDFFSKSRLVWNIPILIAIGCLIYFLPDALDSIASFIVRSKLEVPKQFWVFLAASGTIVTKVFTSYNKIKPLFAALWNVRKKYVENIEEAKHKWKQQEVAILAQIELDKAKLENVEASIVNATGELSAVQYRLLNKLNTEAFQGFIKDKSGIDGYRRHQGIVATIRDDFDTLSKLFEGYSEEAIKNGVVDGDKPLERIVLYIDDLDRCSEARVLEVLEAVHLIMTFNLFVVVVGIDPGRVKSALAAQLNGSGLVVDDRLPSRYLEKIFQVPFHLDKPSDDAVKKMITQLLSSKIKKDTNVPIVVEGRAEEEILKVSEEILQSIPNDVDAGNQQVTLTEGSLVDKLKIEPDEIKRISDFSLLIGNNPRSVKRFVNILRIVRAHGGSGYAEYVSDPIHSDAIMFLLALSIGPYQQLYKSFTKFLEDGPDGDVERYFQSLEGDGISFCKDGVLEFLTLPALSNLSTIGMEIFAAHNQLVSRFSFEELD
jgi:hypothetical protein